MTKECELSNDELASELANGLAELHTEHLAERMNIQSLETSMALMLHQLNELDALQVPVYERECSVMSHLFY